VLRTDACGVGLGALQCSVNKIKSYFNAREGMNFKLSGKILQKKKKLTVIDYFETEAV
jgi:hypothetical protein